MSITWTVSEDNSGPLKAAVKAAILRGLGLAGEHILNKSNGQTPIEDADLIRSGAVGEISTNPPTVGISYDTPYAVRQHEDLSYHHDSGRNAKYLENACRSEAATAGRIVATQVRGAIN